MTAQSTAWSAFYIRCLQRVSLLLIFCSCLIHFGKRSSNNIHTLCKFQWYCSTSEHTPPNPSSLLAHGSFCGNRLSNGCCQTGFQDNVQRGVWWWGMPIGGYAHFYQSWWRAFWYPDQRGWYWLVLNNEPTAWLSMVKSYRAASLVHPMALHFTLIL